MAASGRPEPFAGGAVGHRRVSDPLRPVVSVSRRGGPSRRRGRRKSLFRRPPTSTLAVIGARKPAVCFCRSEQASIAFAAVEILAELA
jgi:hypothetical protein